MKKIGELLKKKQWRWTAAGVLCLVIAMTIFALGAGIGVQAESVTLGSASIELERSGSYYLIKTAEQMNALRNASEAETTGKSFQLANDLSISVTQAAKTIFAGTFDGNGHIITISSVSELTSSGTDTAVSEGLLFGTVEGTVKNLIVDVSTGVSYTRTSKVSRGAGGSSTISVTTDATAPYEGTDEFSAKSEDATAKALAAEFDGWTTENDNIKNVNGTKYYRKSGSQAIKNTTTYTLQTPSTDQFGILCGTLESSGSIEKVYVKGSEGVTVTQAAEKVATETTQTGTRDKYFYYKQGTGSHEEETTPLNISSAITASEKTKVTVYQSAKKETDSAESTEDSVSLKVSAPKYVKSGEAVVYTVTVENKGTEQITLKSIAATRQGNGTWTKKSGESTENITWTTASEKLAASGSAEYYYTVSGVTANREAEKFTLTYEPPAATGGSGEAATAPAPAAEGSTTEKTLATTTGVTTMVIDPTEEGQETKNNGTELEITLKPNHVNYLTNASGNVELSYTLTLENKLSTTGDVLGEALTIAPADIAFSLTPTVNSQISWKISGGAEFTTAELKNPAGSSSASSVTLSGTVTIPKNQITDSESYQASVTVTPSKRVTTKQINTYTYVSNAISGLDAVGTADYGSNSEQDVEASKSPSGNALNAGIIAGTSKGSITQTKQEMTISGTQSEGNTAELKVGGIVGAAKGSAGASDLYILGTQNYAGEGSTLPTGSVSGNGSMPANNTNWASYTKYTSASASETAFDLAWLVESQTVFTYSEPTSKKITVDINAKKTSKDLSYAVAYHARKAMSDSSEDMVYFTNTKEIDLGDSGYYRLLNTYATDGYYHYTTLLTELKDAGFVYPYDSTISDHQPYEIASQTVTRSQDDTSLKDVIRISLTDSEKITGTGNKVYYSEASSGSAVIPTDQSPSAEISNGSVELAFDAASVTYWFVPLINGHIYPTLQTVAFTQADRAPLPAPTVTCFDYYDDHGAKRADTPFVSGGSYEAGTDMYLTPANAAGNEADYSLHYLFSAVSLGGTDWEAGTNRYTGAEDIMQDALSYADSAVIPEGLQGSCYLYVEVSRKNFSSAIYRYGSFTVTGKTMIQASLNGNSAENRPVLAEDLVTLTSQPANLVGTLQYRIGQMGVWTDYTSAGISIPKAVDETCEIGLRIKYADDKYSKTEQLQFTYGVACVNPGITPQTGLKDSGAAAAAPIEQTTQVKLSSTSADAKILYLKSGNADAKIDLQRTTAPSDPVPADGIIGDYKYFQVGARWYRTANTEVNVYSADETKLFLSHTETKEKLMYICAVTIAEDYDISSEQQYIYKVQSQQTAGNPRANLETCYAPGGEDVEMAVVPMGSQVNFYSPTAGVTLYYTIDPTADELTEVVPADGVTVQGTYGREFEVWVQARPTNDNMHASEKIRFVYKIASKEMVNAPTATPGTTTNTPTTVIPGNKILLSTTTKGASIFYTTDESSPNVVYDEAEGRFTEGNDSTRRYEPSVGIEMPMEGSGYFTITAIAVKDGLENSPEVRFPYVYPESVLTPYATVNSGKVTLDTKVVLKNLTEGATIYYNAAYGEKVKEAEVADPTLSSVVYSEGYSFVIRQRTIIKAMAVKDGIKSSVVTFVYDPLAQLAAPTASIETGSVVSNGTVLHLSAASGSSIYYTIDGSDPTDAANAAVMLGNSVTLHGEPGGQITIKAYAKAEDSSQSEVAMFTYQFSQNSMGGVTASVENGAVVSNGTKIILMSDLTGADIYYTTDGRSPVEHGTKGTTVEVNGTPGASFTVKAVAISDGESGIVVTFIYKIKEKPEKPTASPGGGTLTVAARVSLDSGENQIYYTTDGTEPTKSSTLYSEAILINRTTTLKAVAVSADGEMSDVASFHYIAAAKAAMPKADTQSGEVLEPGSRIRFSCDTKEAQIYYTTDGTEPTVNNIDSLLVYDEDGIEISRSVTIKAVAYTDDLRMSNVSSYDYIVDTIPAVEMKKAEAEKLAEEGLKDTDASALTRKNETTKARRASYVLEKNEINVIAASNVQTLFGDDHAILAQYQVRMKGSDADLKTGEAEIALPIPDGYENATLTVAALDSQNKLTTMTGRREDGMLFVKAAPASVYCIIGPEASVESSRTISYILPLEIAAGTVLLAGVGYWGNLKWKKRKKHRKTTRTSDE